MEEINLTLSEIKEKYGSRFENNNEVLDFKTK